jgi:uncharacterized protein with HEPN domain
MSDVRVDEYLDQMIESARLIHTYVEGMDDAAFGADRRTQQAVVLNLLALGEVATRVLQDHAAFADEHADIDWRSMKGIRNRIARSFFDLDHEVVWRTLQESLSPLHGDLVQARAGLRSA